MAWFQVSFFSECHQRTVPLNVLIPADIIGPVMNTEAKPYRTLYLLHGYLGNYTDWLLNTDIAQLSQEWSLAVVMPSGNNGFYVDQPRSGIRGSEFIWRELVEFTRKVFPLSVKREDTLLGGLSMGGWGTLYNALKHGDVFGHAIALSAPVGIDRFADPSHEPPEMGLTPGYFETLFGDLNKIRDTDANLEYLAKCVLNEGLTLPNLYIACGRNDMLAVANRQLIAYFKAIGLPHFYEEGPGTHEWPFWNAFLRRGLEHVLLDRPGLPPNPFWVENN
jgi:S-formylglutathione hydrolase FrmB